MPPVLPWKSSHPDYSLRFHVFTRRGSMLRCFKCARRIGEIERRLVKSRETYPPPCGAIAQLGERIVRNDEVVGSIPTSSTIFSITCGFSGPGIRSVPARIEVRRGSFRRTLSKRTQLASDSGFYREASDGTRILSLGGSSATVMGNGFPEFFRVRLAKVDRLDSALDSLKAAS